MKKLIIILLLIFLTGCSSPKRESNFSSKKNLASETSKSEKPKIEKSETDVSQDNQSMTYTEKFDAVYQEYVDLYGDEGGKWIKETLGFGIYKIQAYELDQVQAGLPFTVCPGFGGIRTTSKDPNYIQADKFLTEHEYNKTLASDYQAWRSAWTKDNPNPSDWSPELAAAHERRVNDPLAHVGNDIRDKGIGGSKPWANTNNPVATDLAGVIKSRDEYQRSAWLAMTVIVPEGSWLTIRKEANKDSEDLGHLPAGHRITTSTNDYIKDSQGVVWFAIHDLNKPNSQTFVGYVASGSNDLDTYLTDYELH